MTSALGVGVRGDAREVQDRVLALNKTMFWLGNQGQGIYVRNTPHKQAHSAAAYTTYAKERKPRQAWRTGWG